MRPVVTLLAVLWVCGCAHEPDRGLTSIEGRSEADVIRTFGVPSRSYPANGGRVLVYRSGVPGFSQTQPEAAAWGGYRPPGYDATQFSGGGPGLDTRSAAGVCDTMFETREGRVQSVRQSGAGCQ
jgi:hypothetical protein